MLVATPPSPPLIAPLLVSAAIVPAFDTPAPPAPAKPPVPPCPPSPPLIAPRSGWRVNRSSPRSRSTRPRRPRPQRRLPPPPFPPLIAPLLVSVVIVPAFDTPAPPAPPTEARRSAVSAADLTAVGQRRDRARVRHACAAGAAESPGPLAVPPLPPLIAPLLVSVAIVPSFDTPAPPAPPALAARLPAPPSAADRAAVGQGRDRARRSTRPRRPRRPRGGTCRRFRR